MGSDMKKSSNELVKMLGKGYQTGLSWNGRGWEAAYEYYGEENMRIKVSITRETPREAVTDLHGILLEMQGKVFPGLELCRK